MQGWHDAAQLILQILSSPVWGGIGVIVSSVLSFMAIFRARQSKTSRPQELQNMHIPPRETRHFIKGSYRRATLVQALVKDVDICLLLSKN